MPDATPTPGTLELLQGNLGRLAGIGLVMISVAGALAYTGGFLSTDRLSADRMADALERSGGATQKGVRRAHSKGICIAGHFVGTTAGRRISSAKVFDGGVVPLTGRFAEATIDPYTRDSAVGIRSMALRLLPAQRGEWRMAINNTPGLQVSTPEAFYDNLVASAPDPVTGQPNPAKMAAFLAKHPESVAFLKRMKAKPLASGFANDSYNSIDGFIFVAPDGMRRLVRWTMKAEDRFEALDPGKRQNMPANYMFNELLARIDRGPAKWRLIATIAKPGDPNRAAELWPDDRQRVDMGELTIDRVESEAPGNCRDLNFDPLILPSGIAASDDPIPFARSAVYASSFRRRAGEVTPPAAVPNQSAGAAK